MKIKERLISKYPEASTSSTVWFCSKKGSTLLPSSIPACALQYVEGRSAVYKNPFRLKSLSQVNFVLQGLFILVATIMVKKFALLEGLKLDSETGWFELI